MVIVIFIYGTGLAQGEIALHQHLSGGKMNIERYQALKAIAVLAGNDRLPSFGALFSKNPVMQCIFRAAKNYSDSLLPVLMCGEMGTGKKSLALEMHCYCKDIKDFHIFDYKKGSIFHYQNHSSATLFIEELERLSPKLQDEVVEYLKWQKNTTQGARIITATCLSDGKLYELNPELNYYLSRVQLKLTPLRERKEDILSLVDFFVSDMTEGAYAISHMSSQLLGKLLDYNWPLNISELRSEIKYLVTKYPDVSRWTTKMVSSKIVGESVQYMDTILGKTDRLTEALESLEKAMILASLQKTNWNKSRASRELGISRSGLIQKVEKYGLGE